MLRNQIHLAGFICLCAAAAAPSRAQLTLNQAWTQAQARQGEPSGEIEWIALGGGNFKMGAKSANSALRDASPTHAVSINPFEMSKTLVTVHQYAECVRKGACTAPETGGLCTWGVEGRDQHPVNCVTWSQAKQFAAFVGARLPSEAEYEFAATSGGKNRAYPWASAGLSPDKAAYSGFGTVPVCSMRGGNTDQGLCDMVGNVWEWTQDKYQDSYAKTPTDGSAFEGGDGMGRVARGGSFGCAPDYVRADVREHNFAPESPSDAVGFRLARSIK